ncbi:hypothetical protein [Natrinema ejinorense]|uniref:Uncharacterized protein n=1 Tax=Natrinema ejinorense TaxID=373386 RepID=A0A2A5QPI2_9EURY|nr:hypothetical protein [Natrinema ejinorense]PCR88695.1 hypothetical protein CP557_21950 [Natrinema ejinorense]
MSAILMLLAIVALAVIVAYWFPDATMRWTRRIIFARKVLFSVAALVIGFVLIGTGLWYLVLLGGFTYLIAAWVGYFQFYKGEDLI